MHRRFLKPLPSDLISEILQTYLQISHLDVTCCPRVDDDVLVAVADAYRTSLSVIDLSRSRFFTNVGLSSLTAKCAGLVEVDLSNSTELTDFAAAAIAEAKNLERLSLARCKLISDIAIGCIAVGCKKLRSVCSKWCLRVSDLGVGLIAMQFRDIRSLDLSYMLITEKCLSHILQLQQLRELILVGYSGIDDEALVTLNQGSKPIEVTADLVKCLCNSRILQYIKLDGCQITCAGTKAIADGCTSLKKLSLWKCIRVMDEGLSSITEKHNGLKRLDITCCRKITHASLDSITSSCTSLASLNMESCTLIHEEAFVLIGQRCTSLEELDITYNHVIDDGLKSISRCSQLLILKLGICMKITDIGLYHVGMCSPNLKQLDLYRCTGITDVGFMAVANGCLALEMISMAYCVRIDVILTERAYERLTQKACFHSSSNVV